MTGAAAPRSRGPRGGGSDTRGDILAAATAVFGEKGYSAASVRAIARAAGVDPALVRHYFADKSQLFIEAMRPAQADDPRLLALVSAPRDTVGAGLVATFVELWDDAVLGPRMRGVLLSALTTPEVAQAAREVLMRDVVMRLAREDRRDLRAGAAASQLVGLAGARYLMRIPSIVAADASELAALYGPTLQRYLEGDLDLRS